MNNMARPLRIEYEGALYIVTARGKEPKRIYFTKTDYGKFREYIKGAQEKYGCLLHAYVFMTNGKGSCGKQDAEEEGE